MPCPKKLKNWSVSGFTVIEIIIVMMFFTMLYGLITINLLNAKHSATVNAQEMLLLSDIKNQQLKTMIGDSEGRTVNDDYGIFFETNRYFLFHGSSYIPNDPTNFEVKLGENIIIADISFPESTLLFSKLSGEIAGFVPGSNIITFKNTQNQKEKTFTFNRYGVITGIN